MQNILTRLLPEKVTTRSRYTGTKRSSKLVTAEASTLKEHQHGIVQYVKCMENNCSESYIDEARCRLTELVIDHKER